MRPRTALAALCLASSIATAQADDPNLARNLAATCANCHGTDGRSVGGMARLAGEPKESLLRKLRGFRTGERPATIMPQIVRGYTDEQLTLIAAYFAAQRPDGARP